MGSLFIIGNGFDLAHGLPTAYKNFRRYILNQYPDVEIFKDTSINLDDYEQLPADEFAAEILVYAMDHAAGTEWGDFEDALSRINFFINFLDLPNTINMIRRNIIDIWEIICF